MDNPRFLNQIMLDGNIVKDTDYFESPVPHARSTIATEWVYKDADGERHKEVYYCDIDSFGGLSEMMGEYGKKGRGIRVVGRLKQNRWKDEDGNCRSPCIIAEHVEFKPGEHPSATGLDKEVDE